MLSGCHFQALRRREFALDDLTQLFLKSWIPIVSKLDGKTDNSRLTDTHFFAKTGRGHERRLVIMVHDEIGNELLPFAEGAEAILHATNKMFHVYLLVHPFFRGRNALFSSIFVLSRIPYVQDEKQAHAFFHTCLVLERISSWDCAIRIC